MNSYDNEQIRAELEKYYYGNNSKYDSDIAKVKEVLTDIVMKEECRMEEEPTNIYVSDLADSSIQMGVRFWVKKDDYWTTKWRVTENIKLAFDANDISIPFPQLDVQIKQ